MVERRTYRIDDPDEGHTDVKAIDPYNAADVYFQSQWAESSVAPPSGTRQDLGTVRVTDVASGERWMVSCKVTMEPNFDLSIVKAAP